MSGILIYAQAFDSEGKSYGSDRTNPEIANFIESVTPSTVPHSLQGSGQYMIVDTTDGACLVTAAPFVTLPSGEGRLFSYWNDARNLSLAPRHVQGRELAFSKDEGGAVSVVYGVRAEAYILRPSKWLRYLLQLLRYWIFRPAPTPAVAVIPTKQDLLADEYAKFVAGLRSPMPEKKAEKLVKEEEVVLKS